MPIEKLFPTYFYRTRFSRALVKSLNRQIEKESYIFKDIDQPGKEWSKENYLGGYTSYSSITDLPFRSSTFDRLKSFLDREALKFAETLDWDLSGGRLQMSTCWINIMGHGCHHSFHLHPRSVISGTYFVKVPKGAGVFKIEDPRIARFMAAPPLRAKHRKENKRYVSFEPLPGEAIFFESWLKHEVPANHAKSDRISISFNYDWV